jgi:predicted DCC family thiol-disulfide oxidoreductase YuxK
MNQIGTIPSRQPNLLLYDDACSMCVFQTRVLSWLDWRNRIRLVPISSPQAHEIAPQLTREDLHEAIHCVTPDGRIFRGARALRHVGMRMPVLWPLAVGLWLPGVIQIAEYLYRLVARNRYVLSRFFGCDQACAILPARQRPANEQPSSSL